MLNLKNKKVEPYVFLIPLIIFILIKIPHLSIPYFWDEAWSYFPSIKAMADHGPSLLPGSIPMGDSKGHPQLFLFMISSWMNIYPGSVTFLRIFNFTLSLILLLVAYLFLKKDVSLPAATTGISLISVQSLFFAQSTMIFPEILASLLLLISVFLFYKGQYAWYALLASLMVLTKETFLIFAFTLGINYVISLFKREKRQFFKPLHLLFLLIPAFAYGAHLLIHYFEFKTFLYNEHTSYIDFRWDQIQSKFLASLDTIFVSRGRILITISFLLLLIISMIRKVKVSYRFFWIFITIVIPYLAFSAINSFAFRYLLAPMVLFIFTFAYILGELTKSRILYILTLLLSGTCLYYSLTIRKTDDHSLGYIEVAKVQKKLVGYCEKHNLYDEPIATNFLVSYAFKGSEYGYRSTNKEFKHMMPWAKFEECKYFIYDLTPDVPNDVLVKIQNEFKLVQTFEDKHARGFIYENKAYSKTHQ